MSRKIGKSLNTTSSLITLLEWLNERGYLYGVAITRTQDAAHYGTGHYFKIIHPFPAPGTLLLDITRGGGVEGRLP